MITQLNARIVHKHDIEANWLKLTDFIPMHGELVIYDSEIAADGTVLQLPEGRNYSLCI